MGVEIATPFHKHKKKPQNKSWEYRGIPAEISQHILNVDNCIH